MAKIGIVGAGVAGLTVAYALRNHPAQITIFEKSRGFGGRAATRGRNGCRYDHGAPYFSPSTSRVERLVTDHLSTEDLLAIDRPVGTFDQDGTCRLSASGSTADPKWTYVQGISTLGKLLARQCGADIHRTTRIDRLSRDDRRWHVHTEAGETASGYDAVVLTPPAPQSRALLGSLEPLASARRVRELLESVHYTPRFAYVLAYDRLVDRPDDFYGLRGPDTGHPLHWIGFESDKPGHAPEGQTLLVLHTAEDWTAPRVDQAPEPFLSDVRAAAEDVLSTSLRDPVWTDTQRWRYAQPEPTDGLDPTAGAEDGVFLAGDAVAGGGTVASAIESGFDTAARLREHLTG